MSEKLYTLVLEFDGVCDCNECQGDPIPDLVDSFDSPAEVGQGLSDWCYEYAPSGFRVEVGGEPASDLELQSLPRSTNTTGASRGGDRSRRHERGGDTVVLTTERGGEGREPRSSRRRPPG